MTQPDAGSEHLKSSSPSRRLRRGRRVAAGLAALILALDFIGVLGGNVHTVAPGRLYRTAQLTGITYTGLSASLVGNGLPNLLRADGIRTVINLRGGSPDKDFYREEVADCAARQVDHVDIPLSARKLPPPDQLLALLRVFDTGKYPMLVHCQGGADRTGLVSTLYADIYMRQPLDTAEREQLTWRYGHLPVGPTRAMDAFFDLYRRTAGGLTLRQWIERKYPALYAASPLKGDPAPPAVTAASR